MVLGLRGNVLLGDGGQHHLLHDVLPQSLQGHLLRVLAGDDNSVDPARYVRRNSETRIAFEFEPGGDASSVLKVVLGGDLGLGVWPRPPQCSVTSG